MHYTNMFYCEISLVYYHPGICAHVSNKQATSYIFLASKIILVSLLPTPLTVLIVSLFHWCLLFIPDSHVLLYPSNTFDLKDFCFMNVRHFPVGCTGGGGKLLKLQNDWQIINKYVCWL